MKLLVVSLATTLISSSVLAGNARAAPEIDGTLSVVMIALVGGLALMLKKKSD